MDQQEYQEHHIGVLLARMEGKLDTLHTEFAGKLDSIKQQLDTQGNSITRHDLEISQMRDRITTLEATRPKNVPAWAGVIVAFIGVTIAAIALILQ